MKFKFIIIPFLLLFLYSTASAISLGFDPSGTGATFTDIIQFTLGGNPELADAPAGAENLHDLWSYQDANGDFTESFTMQVNNADLVGLGGEWDLDGNGPIDYNLWVDMTLTGNVDFLNQLATFSAGSATMYVDVDGNEDFTGPDTAVADFVLTLPAVMVLDDTVLDLGLEGDINLIFAFTATYFDFWDATVDQMTADGVLLALIGEGDISVAEILTIGDQTVIGWDLAAVEVEFTVVPEPATILLFGIGLLGLAGVVRKKFKKV